MPESASTVRYEIARGKHTVAFSHQQGDVEEGVISVSWGGYGNISTSSASALNVSHSVEVVRDKPHRDDTYPLDMPHSIANLTVYVQDSDGGAGGIFTPDNPDYDHTKMSHMYVQPEARGEGYGTMLWDVYVVVSAAVGGDAKGKIGETPEGDTLRFLTGNGVPEEDTNVTSGAWSAGEAVGWDTQAANIVDAAPITRDNPQ